MFGSDDDDYELTPEDEAGDENRRRKLAESLEY
jgi:hypothetical protein